MPTLKQHSGPQVVPRVRDVPLVANPLTAGERVLLVAAHPDDETIGAGRLVAGHRGEVRAVTVSAGESCVVDDRLDPLDLVVRRLGEWRRAVLILGGEAVDTARWPDGRLGDHEQAVAEELSGLMARADVVVTTWRHDPHPDHQAVGRASAAAAAVAGVRVVEFPVWAPYWMTPSEVAAHGYRICATDSVPGSDDARRDALLGYASQTRALLPGLEPVVPESMLARHDRQLLACPCVD